MNSTLNIFVPSVSTKKLNHLKTFEGGFGKVLIVESEENEKYALKTLKWELGLNKKEFYSEADKLLKIEPHQNVISLFDLVDIENNPYLCMPYLKESLRQKLNNGKINYQLVEKVIKDVSLGLDHIHKKANLLHLDLKPENVLVDYEGNHVIADFGISKFLPRPQDDKIHNELFQSDISGTLIYMSPEHFTSQPVSSKTDVFAMGIMIFEMLTGKHPFLDSSLNSTVQNVINRPVSFSLLDKMRIPRKLRAICKATLSKNPEHRPAPDSILKSLMSSNQISSIQDEFNYTANVNRANGLVARKKEKEAIKIYYKCIEVNPYRYEAPLNLSSALFRIGEYDKAISTAEPLIDQIKWDKTVNQELGTLYVNLSNFYMVKDPSVAIKLSRKAISLDNQDWQALGNLAESARIFGESRGDLDLIEEGLNAIENALKINPSDLKLRVTYGGLLLVKKDSEKLWPVVVKLANEAAEHDVPARVLLIRTFIFKGEIETAKEWIEPMREHKALKSIITQLDEEINSKVNV